MSELRTWTAHVGSSGKVVVEDRLQGRVKVSAEGVVPLQGLVAVIGQLVSHEDSVFGSGSWQTYADFDDVVAAVDFVLSREFGRRSE